MESFPHQTMSTKVQACQFAYLFPLASVADRATQTLLTSVRSSENADIDRGVFQGRLKEKEQRFLLGPIPATNVPQGA